MLDYVLEDLDLVLLMSVNPGFGGQGFIPSALRKIRELKAIIQDRGLDIPIEVDGGVNLKTIRDVAAAGAEICVAGSAVYGTEDYAATIRALKKAAG